MILGLLRAVLALASIGGAALIIMAVMIGSAMAQVSTAVAVIGVVICLGGLIAALELADAAWRRRQPPQ